MRKALIVGVDYYESVSSLYGCVNDAYSVKSAIERNSDGTLNFHLKLLTAPGPDNQITRKVLKEHIIELFKYDSEISLLYFAGHGHIESTGGYLLTSECEHGDEGLALNELMKIVNDSPSKNRIIILDTCHSGIIGTFDPDDGKAILKEGVTILTASGADQYAIEKDGSGIFTNLFVDALNGSAANLIGDITPGSIYAHIDQSLGGWQQRPIFKTNIKSFVTLKKVQAPILLEDLKRIVEIFPEKGYVFKLDPSFEPDSDCPDENNIQIFAILQKYNRINLLVPLDTPHMYYAAMESKSCRLTILGEHYWNLVKNERI